ALASPRNVAELAHDPESGYRFSEKIMLEQKARARWRFDEEPSRSSAVPTPSLRSSQGRRTRRPSAVLPRSRRTRRVEVVRWPSRKAWRGPAPDGESGAGRGA